MKKSVLELIGAPISTATGDVVGMIDDVIINASTGSLEYLSVQPAGNGASMRVRLTWREITLDPDRSRFILAPGDSAVKRLLEKASAGTN